MTDEWETLADEAIVRRDYGAALVYLARAVESEPVGFTTWLKLSVMRRATGDVQGALDVLDRALTLRPLDFSALLMRGALLEASGNGEEAGLTYGRALANAPHIIPAYMRDATERARRSYSTWQDNQARQLRDAAQSVAALTPNVDRMITNAVRLTAPDADGPTHYCFPGMPKRSFYNRSQFPWLKELEASTEMIVAELGELLVRDRAQKVPYVQYGTSVPLAQWVELNHNPDWTAIHLIQRGESVERNARQCPKTMNLLADLPQPKIMGAGPNAMFSLLAPHTHIPPHTGVTNTRLLCHLPLIIPQGCSFRVGTETRDWEVGTAWVFDDTVEHEALNPSDKLRVIMIFDIWHPALSKVERNGVAATIGAGGQVHGL